MALRSTKNSAFVAFQLAGSDSDGDNSADERREEQKSKQKAKKKSRSKKKNSESAVLKDLAMCAVSKSKKSKSKSKSASSPEPASTAVPEASPGPPLPVAPPLAAPAPVAALAPVESTKLATKPAVTAPKAEPKASSAVNKPPPATAKPTHAPSVSTNGVGTAQQQTQTQQPQSQPNGTDLAAIYSPTHVKITRADGQMTRTIAVSEMMDQLYLFGHQNAQLRIVQEQLTVANRGMQEQLQRDAEMISTLQNEVTMFRQMCLNLQAEVSMLRAAASGGAKPPSAEPHRPPPGM